MRIAVTGKGGSGKSVVAAGIAMALGALSEGVLAIDLDTNPGLAMNLGVPLGSGRLGGDAVAEIEGADYGYGLRAGLAVEDAVDLFSVRAAGSVRFLQIGNIERPDHDLGRYVTAVRSVAAGFSRPGWHVVADLEAGPTTPYEGYARFADIALVVCEPDPVSLLAAARLAAILREEGTSFRLLGNKLREPGDGARVSEAAAALGSPEPLLVPYDRKLELADRRRGAIPRHSPARLALERAAAMLAPMAVPA